MSDDKIAKKIESLIRQANDPGATEDESRIFMEKAFALSEKYNTDLAMIAARSGIQDSQVVYLDMDFSNSKYSLSKIILVHGMAENLGLQGIRVESALYRVFGYPSDLDSFKLLALSVIAQGDRFATAAEIPFYENTKTFRTAWWRGYASRISSRHTQMIRQARREYEEENHVSTDLVLRDKALNIKDAFNVMYPRVRKTYYNNTSSSGYNAGREAADNVNLGQTAISGGPKLIGA